jgi:membrane protein DedA with SNARE-associated domain
MIHIFFNFIIHFISFSGYFGIFLLMLLESACVPIPSEIILPFSGYLASIGRFNLIAAVSAGILGDFLGAVLIYLVVRNRGMKFFEKYGKYVFVSNNHLHLAERFFQKYGKWSVCIGRMLSVVRTFIALPAGIMGVDFISFCGLTFIGSAVWCSALSGAGFFLGKNWVLLQPYFKAAEIPILLVLGIGLLYWFWMGKKNNRLLN